MIAGCCVRAQRRGPRTMVFLATVGVARKRVGYGSRGALAGGMMAFMRRYSTA
jgi:hypothetical protein